MFKNHVWQLSAVLSLILMSVVGWHLNAQTPDQNFTLNFSSDPDDACVIVVRIDGEVADSGTKHAAGSELEVMYIAYPSSDGTKYEFVNWTVNGEEKSRKSYLRTVMNEDVNIVAHFKEEGGSTPEVVKHKVTFTSEPTEGGSILAKIGDKEIKSGDEIKKGEVITFLPVAKKDYMLQKWVYRDKEQTNAKLELTVNSDLDVKALFIKKTEQLFAVTFDNPEHGKLTATLDGKELLKGAKVKKSASIVFTVTPEKGYVVDKWMLYGTIEASDSYLSENKTVCKAKVFRDMSVEVILKKDETISEKPKVTFRAEPVEGGTLTAKASGSGLPSESEVEVGTTVFFTATAKEGYEIDKWTVNGVAQEATGPHLVHKITETSEVVVYFKLIKSIDTVAATTVKVYPNPAVDYVVVEGVVANAQVAVYSANGAIVAMAQANAEGQARIDVNRLVAGNYLVKVGTVTKNLIVK